MKKETSEVMMKKFSQDAQNYVKKLKDNHPQPTKGKKGDEKKKHN